MPMFLSITIEELLCVILIAGSIVLLLVTTFSSYYEADGKKHRFWRTRFTYSDSNTQKLVRTFWTLGWTINILGSFFWTRSVPEASTFLWTVVFIIDVALKTYLTTRAFLFFAIIGQKTGRALQKLWPLVLKIGHWIRCGMLLPLY